MRFEEPTEFAMQLAFEEFERAEDDVEPSLLIDSAERFSEEEFARKMSAAINQKYLAKRDEMLNLGRF